MHRSKSNMLWACLYLLLAFAIGPGCTRQNPVDAYRVSVDSLLLLPDGFYGYRSEMIYMNSLGTPRYRVWIGFAGKGRIGNLVRVNNPAHGPQNTAQAILAYGLDTLQLKKDAQQFVDLAHRYKFGHVYVDRRNLVYFSDDESIGNQYVKTFNDSITDTYRNDKEFIILANGWFEYIEQ